jgi:hypothetical protein
MAGRDPYDTQASRRRGDTEPNIRRDAEQPAHADPLNPDWRVSRGPRRSRRSQGLPSSRQEFVLWLQFGGWRVVLAAIGLVALTIWLIWLTGRSAGTPSPFGRATDTALGAGAGASTLPLQATVTPRPTGTAPTSAAATTSGGAQFRVVNTGAEGLFLRPDHSTAGAPLKTLAEGTVVAVIGADFSGPDRVWKNVRDPDGAEGWVAADFLQLVQ